MDDMMAKALGEKPDASPGKDAAKDILAAIAAKDATALDLALTRHYECCSGDEPDADDEEDTEEA